MRVVSAFFADHVSIYEQKLFVQGGVWDWYKIPSDALPTTARLPVALITQLSSEDLGVRHDLKVTVHGPDGTAADPPTIQAHIASDWPGEHWSAPLGVEMPLVSHGRYAVVFEVDGDTQNAFTLPLNVIRP